MVRLATVTTAFVAIASTSATMTFDAWTGTDYNGTTFHTEKAGKFPLDFYGKSFKFYSDGEPEECCVALCANLLEQSYYTCTSLEKTHLAPREWLRRVVIACGYDTPDARCDKPSDDDFFVQQT